MSTAGKVLISLIMVMTLIWIVVISGVDQLDRNGNALLAKLDAQVRSLTEQVEQVQHDIAANKDRTTLQQEATDREITRLRSSQSDIERARSEASSLLSEVQLELANMDVVVKNAHLDQDRRLAEKEAEEQAIGALKTELAALKATNKQMLARIADLRAKFRKSYRANLEIVSQSK
jgi:hypothetical protein